MTKSLNKDFMYQFPIADEFVSVYEEIEGEWVYERDKDVYAEFYNNEWHPQSMDEDIYNCRNCDRVTCCLDCGINENNGINDFAFTPFEDIKLNPPDSDFSG